MSHPLDDLISLAERTYIRLEAEQLIEDCLNKVDSEPFAKRLEELIMAGSDSLAVLREILMVIRSLKSSLNQEGMEVKHDLKRTLSQFGVSLPYRPSVGTKESFWQIYHYGFFEQIKADAPWLEIEDQLLLEEICTEAGKRVSQIVSRLVFLLGLEEMVIDWIHGMIYEIAHSSDYSHRTGHTSFHH